MQLSNEIRTIGSTYSNSDYEHYFKNGDLNYFEEIIDKMILEEVAGMNQSFKQAISNLSRDRQRMAILSLLDKDRNLYLKIKALINKNINKMDHIKDIIMMLRQYVKVGEIEKDKFGEVMTPLELVKEMLSVLPNEVWSNPNLKWLDPANGTGPYPIMVIYKLMNGLKDWEPDDEKRYKHIVENMIYACELQPKNMFLYMCAIDPFDLYKLNIYTGSFMDKGFDRHMKEIWNLDKFDIVIGNPPYLKNLHIKFLEKSADISDKVLFIHPSPWIFRRESLASNSSNRIKSIRLLNGNYYFKKAEFGAPLTVTYVEENYTDEIEFTYDTTSNKYNVKIIPSGFWEPSLEILNLIEKFKKLSNQKNLSQLLCKNTNQDFIITTPRICGHAVIRNDKNKFVTDDFYTLFYHRSNLSDINTSNKVFSVKSTEERERLIKYLRSKICRFGLYINKLSQDSHINKYLSNIPVPPLDRDFTENELCEFFEIKPSEYEIIVRLIPKYYN